TVSAGTAPPRPLLLGEQGLQALAGSRTDPIYWAGARPGTTYEVTRTESGHIFVRYLPTGAGAAARGSTYLTVATYPQPNAPAQLPPAPRRSGSVTIRVAGGGLFVSAAARPTNFYLAYPGAHEQVEIYDPPAPEALRFARSGRVRPFSASAQA